MAIDLSKRQSIEELTGGRIQKKATEESTKAESGSPATGRSRSRGAAKK